MKIVIAGGSGFVGQELTKSLSKAGHELVILTRAEPRKERNISYIQWLQGGAVPEDAIKSADVFINLAGISINEGRWNSEHQKQIYDSRMIATEELLRIMTALQSKPSILINASAIGIYPASDTAVYTEASTDIATGFLARTVADWEKKAAQAETESIRTTFMRFGVILGKNAGALPPMILPYKLFAGGTVGTGRQWISWVHVEDVVRAISFAIQNNNLRGPVNVTAPSPIRMADFGKTIGAVLRRPHWFPVPSIIMKIALGKKSALVLEGQHVLPKKLLDNGFEFHYPTLEAALKNLL